MYALGDKYDIAGLRTSSSARLKDMLDSTDLSLDAYIDVWESAYESSHGRDELREVIARHIDGKLIKYAGSSMGRAPGFLEFLDRVPELSSVLLKNILRRSR